MPSAGLRLTACVVCQNTDSIAMRSEAMQARMKIHALSEIW